MVFGKHRPRENLPEDEPESVNVSSGVRAEVLGVERTSEDFWSEISFGPNDDRVRGESRKVQLLGFGIVSNRKAEIVNYTFAVRFDEDVFAEEICEYSALEFKTV